MWSKETSDDKLKWMPQTTAKCLVYAQCFLRMIPYLKSFLMKVKNYTNLFFFFFKINFVLIGFADTISIFLLIAFWNFRPTILVSSLFNLKNTLWLLFSRKDFDFLNQTKRKPRSYKMPLLFLNYVTSLDIVIKGHQKMTWNLYSRCVGTQILKSTFKRWIEVEYNCNV